MSRYKRELSDLAGFTLAAFVLSAFVIFAGLKAWTTSTGLQADQVEMKAGIEQAPPSGAGHVELAAWQAPFFDEAAPKAYSACGRLLTGDPAMRQPNA